MILTEEILKASMPKALEANIKAYVEPLRIATAKFGVDTPIRLACFISQMAHESSCLAAKVENLNYSALGLMNTFGKYFKTIDHANKYARQPEKIANYVYANRLGNGDEASGDGWKYRGRGPFQITGEKNYTLCGKAIGVDLVANPDLLLIPEYGALAAGWFWSSNNLNRYADLNTIDGYTKLTKAINGGYNGLNERIVFLSLAKKALKLAA